MNLCVDGYLLTKFCFLVAETDVIHFLHQTVGYVVDEIPPVVPSTLPGREAEMGGGDGENQRDAEPEMQPSTNVDADAEPSTEGPSTEPIAGPSKADLRQFVSNQVSVNTKKKLTLVYQISICTCRRTTILLQNLNQSMVTLLIHSWETGLCN